MDVISSFTARYERSREEELARGLPPSASATRSLHATAAERMLKAIGEPQTVDTRNDPRLSRIFANKVIKRYPAFAEFYGMEDRSSRSSASSATRRGPRRRRSRSLYLLGPVGGGKSSIAERLKATDAGRPFYAIKGSPVNESPLGLFDADEDGPILESSTASRDAT